MTKAWKRNKTQTCHQKLEKKAYEKGRKVNHPPPTPPTLVCIDFINFSSQLTQTIQTSSRNLQARF